MHERSPTNPPDKNKIIAAALLDAYNRMVTSVKTTGYAYSPQPTAVLLPQDKALH